MTDTNPILYSDLIKDDGAIKTAISQLEELMKTYNDATEKIKNQASELAQSINKTTSATEEGRKQTRSAATEADKLAAAEQKLADAKTKTAKELARLRELTREQNNINKLTVKLNESAEGSYNKLSAQYSLNKIKLNQMSDAERHATEEGKKLERETAAIYEQMKKLQEATGKHTLNVGNYSSALNGLGGVATNIASKIGAGGLGGAIQSMGGALGGLGTAGMGAAAGAGPIGVAVAGVVAIGAAMADGISVSMDYNKSLSTLAAITGETAESLKPLADQARQLGATTRYTATEVVELQTELAKLGYAKTDILNMTDSVLYFAQATGASLADASSLTGAALRMFEKDTDQTGEFVDKMAAATTKSALSFDYLNNALSTVSPVANTFGFNIEDVLALLGNLANAGFDASSAATATRNILLNLADSNGKLAKSLGEPVTDLDGLVKGLQKLNSEGIDLATTLELTDKRSVAAFNTFLSTADGVQELRDSINGASGAAEAMATVMADNLEGDIASMGSAWDDLMIEFNGGQGVLRAIVQWLTSIVRGIGDWNRAIKAYFVELWNDSDYFRQQISGFVLVFRVAWDTIVNIWNGAVDVFKAGGKIIHGVFTFDWDEIVDGVKDVGMAYANFVKQTASDVVDDWNSAMEMANTKFETPEVEPPSPKPAPRPDEEDEEDGKGKTTPLTEKEIKELLKKREELYKKERDAQRKAQDAELALMDDGFDKQKIKTNLTYSRQIEDLKHYLKTTANISKNEKESINAQISAIESKWTDELVKIEQQRAIRELEQSKTAIQLRLKSAEKGTEEYKKLRLQEVEIDKQISIAKNELLSEDKQQSADLYSDIAKAQTKAILDEYNNAQLANFDAQQELAQSEFDLLKTTEAKKTEYRLQAEKARLQKILELNETAGTKMSDVEVQTIKNTIAKIDQDIQQNAKDARFQDIYSMFGLNLDSKQKDAINESLDFAVQQLDSFMQSRVQAADKAKAAADSEIADAQRRLDAEVEARNAGYASEVETARKELETARQNQEKAIKQQQKAQRQQAALQSIQQAGDLVTASAKIWGELGFPWAIPAIATMWGSFAASKIKARQATKEEYGEGTVELLQGGSHASGNDIDLGTKPDGTRRRAEGGEYFAVINKRNSRKFNSIIPGVIRSFNDGTFLQKYMSTDSINANVTINGNDEQLARLNDTASAIKQQNENRVIQNGNVVIYKNLKRVIR